MKTKELRPIFAMFIVAVVGVAFITAAANSLSPSTQLQTLTNDSVNIASARLVGNQINNSQQFTMDFAQSVTNRTPLSNFVLTNGSGVVISQVGNYSINLVTGVLNLTNSTYWVSGGGLGNTTLASYNYKSSSYVEDNGSRTIFDLIVFFAALGLLISVIGYLKWDDLRDWFGR